MSSLYGESNRDIERIMLHEQANPVLTLPARFYGIYCNQ